MGKKRPTTWQRVKRIHLFFAFCLLPFAMPLASLLSAAQVAVATASSVRVYPNPWRVDKHPQTLITFDQAPAGSIIKIFTVSAREVRTLTTDSNGRALWDRLNGSGSHVASGIYIYLLIDPQGNESSGKLAIIR